MRCTALTIDIVSSVVVKGSYWLVYAVFGVPPICWTWVRWLITQCVVKVSSYQSVRLPSHWLCHCVAKALHCQFIALLVAFLWHCVGLVHWSAKVTSCMKRVLFICKLKGAISTFLYLTKSRCTVPFRKLVWTDVAVWNDVILENMNHTYVYLQHNLSVMQGSCVLLRG